MLTTAILLYPFVLVVRPLHSKMEPAARTAERLARHLGPGTCLLDPCPNREYNTNRPAIKTRDVALSHSRRRPTQLKSGPRLYAWARHGVF